MTKNPKGDVDDRLDAIETAVSALKDRLDKLEAVAPVSGGTAPEVTAALADLTARIGALEDEVFPPKADATVTGDLAAEAGPTATADSSAPADVAGDGSAVPGNDGQVA